MAEQNETSFDLLDLVNFASDSAILFRESVGKATSRQRAIRELKQELEALQGTLRSLQEAVTNNTVRDPALKRPLLQCSQVCKGFNSLIAAYAKQPGGMDTFSRNWSTVTYMGCDSARIKEVLSIYKSTATIAIKNASLPEVSATEETTGEYQDLGANTISDIREHIQDMEQRLEQSVLPTDAVMMKNEIGSMESCLEICTLFLEHVNQLRLHVVENLSATAGNVQIDTEVLRYCSPAGQFISPVTDTGKTSVQHRVNNYDEISAARRASQIIVSNHGGLIFAKKVTAEENATQWFGQISDETLQRLSRDRKVEISDLAYDTKGSEGDSGLRFRTQYGTERKLGHSDSGILSRTSVST